MIKHLSMSTSLVDEIRPPPTDDESQRRIKTEFTRKLLQFYPDAANEIREQGIEQGIEQGVEKGVGPLVRLFERKLARALTAAEHELLVRRLDTHGATRLGDVVFDLDAAALDAWLRDPAAT